jgi:hypothetical protein
MARLRIRHDDVDRQRAWIAEVLASAFTVEVEPPVLTRRPKTEPNDPGPTLLDLLAAMEAPAPVADDDVPCACPELRRMMLRSGALQPLTPLALKRRRLAAERAAAARAPVREGNDR